MGSICCPVESNEQRTDFDTKPKSNRPVSKASDPKSEKKGVVQIEKDPLHTSRSDTNEEEDHTPYKIPVLEEKNEKSHEASVVSSQKSEDQITPDDFDKLQIIGKGAYGTVYLVIRKDDPTKTLLAMKEILKSAMKQKNQMVFLMRERDMLVTFKCPFIVDLKSCMQDDEKVYFVFEFMAGGDLYHHLRESRRFGEKRAVFYVAQLVLAIEYLHKTGIIYRDLKPENILMDEQGYIKLSDFGLSKQADVTSTFCGTADYLAPEMVAGNKHDKNIDWWMLGINLFEMLTGSPPFSGGNKMQVCKKIQTTPVPVKPDMSKEAQDLIQKLLDKDPEKRLGCKNDSKDIKDHPFFASINWDQLARREIDALFKPEIGQDKLNCFKKMKQQGGVPENQGNPAEPADSFDENKLPGFTYHADTFKEKLKNIDME